MKKLEPSGRTTIARLAIGVTTAATFAVGLTTAFAADHRDGASVQGDANIAADINDVYAFMAGDKAVLGMTVFPVADTDSKFSDASVYTFHVGRHAAFGTNAAATTDVLCTFDEAQQIECWVGDDEYVTGDASSEEGITSDSGRVRVFAGLRTDPFFFYLDGFNAARGVVQSLFGGLTLNPNGCPLIDADAGATLRDLLSTDDQADDFFDELNTLAIVVEMDKEVLVDTDNAYFSVYASTHVKQ